MVLCDNLEGWGGDGGGREVQEGGDLRLIHVVVWQKPTQNCKTIAFQLKKNFFNIIVFHCWWKCKLVQPLWRTVWRFLKKLEIELPCDPAIPFLGIHTEETRIERDTCTPIFITALDMEGLGSNLDVHQQMNG